MNEERLPEVSPRVFISHAGEDKAFVRKLALLLHDNGIDTFFDEWEIGLGESIRRKIEEGLKDCTHFVFVLSATSVDKEWVNLEVDAAFVRKVAQEQKLFPILYRLPPENLPPLVAGMSWLAIDDSLEGAWQLIKEIHSLPKKPPVRPKPASEQSVFAEPHSEIGVLNDILDFLGHLANAGLKKHIVFRPEFLKAEDIFDFCIPPRIIDEEEWQKLQSLAVERHSQSSNKDQKYALPTHELSLEIAEATGRYPVHSRSLVEDIDRWTHVILRGEPGEGKTTALWLQVANLCRRLVYAVQHKEMMIDDATCRVPLALPLSFVAAPRQDLDLVRLCRDYVLRVCYGELEKVPKTVYSWLEAKICSRQFSLFLDGLDELVSRDWHSETKEHLSSLPMSRRDWLKSELERYDEVPTLITSRFSANDHGLLHDPHRFRTICFGEGQIHQFIRRYFLALPNGSAYASELRARLRLSPGPRHLAQLPLLLAVLCEVKARYPKEKLPESRTKLLQRGLQYLFENGDRRRGITRRRRMRNLVKESILRRIAWAFYREEPLPIMEDPLLHLLVEERERLETDLPRDSDALLAEYIEDGVLVTSGHDSYRFILRSFHEYCVAGYIACELNNTEAHEFIRQIAASYRKGYPGLSIRHKELLPLLAAQSVERCDWLLEEWLPDNGYATYISRGYGVPETFMLIATIIRESQSDSKKMRAVVTEMIRGLDIEWGYDWEYQDWSKESAYYLRKAVSVLGHVSARDELIARLEKSSNSVDTCYSVGLGSIGDDQARDALIRGLDRGDASCAVGLGMIGDSLSKDVLLKHLKNPRSSEKLLIACASALGHIADDLSIQALIQFFRNSARSFETRERCLRSLGGSYASDWRNDYVTPSDVRDICESVLRSYGYGETEYYRQWPMGIGAQLL